MIRKIVDFILSGITKISPKLNTKICYLIKFHKKIEMINPKKFNEKILWLKLNEYPFNEKYSSCADKFKVRDYVKNKGYESILIPIICSCDKASEINFSLLPQKFVIKWNFGWGYNIICKNKNKLNINSTIKKLDKWEKSKFYLRSSELHYQNIDKKIIIEKYIGTKDSLPVDYKFYCFNGKVKYVMVCVGRDNLKKTLFYFFDKNWNFMKFDKTTSKIDNVNIKKPKNIKKMFDIAEDLSSDFEFVRVDLYSVNDKIYFSELTFTPASGLDTDITEEADIFLGDLLDISKINSKSEG